jgi:nondiscriminating glutamyl-tRNA synthetase
VTDNKTPRVRFAPSPTGLLHVGNARTALYNWLYARHAATGGTFILRVEDTDLERSETRYETQLIEDLRWLGLEWDEGPVAFGGEGGAGSHGPYRQSERLEIYREHADRLLSEGKAYRCFCTAAELDAEREHAMKDDHPHVYSGRCRSISAAESASRAATESFAVRLNLAAVNGTKPLDFEDVVRGHVSFDPATLSDPVIVRAAAQVGEAGIPLYNFVVVVDDALMKITHVIRGDDHISNTPRQIAVYRAFGWPVPKFAHLSTIQGQDHQRLSKRHGATSVATFREMGYLPEALTNYLALLGWAPTGGDRELFSPEELVREFDLARVTPSPAVFDFNKLNWINRQYMKHAAPGRLAALALPYFPQMQGALKPGEQAWFEKLLALLVPSVDRLDQLPARAQFIFQHDPAGAKTDEDNAAVLATPAAQSVLSAFAKRVEAERGPITVERFKALINEVKEETGVKGKDLFHPIRIALTGSHSGPEFDKIVPLMEEGNALGLPVQIPGVRERFAAFCAV